VETKRRLPVLKTPAEHDEEGPARPPWQWVGFGVLAIFVVWLPLAFLAGLAAMKLGGFGGLGASPGLSVAVLASGLAIAATAGGFLVGRWGPPGVGVREAALAGLAAALVASGLSLGAPGALAGAVVTIAVAVPFAALGGRLGLRRRPH
jgi:hypothetical protein